MLAGYSLVSARPVNSVDGFRLSSLSWSLMNSLSELAFPLTLLVRCKNFELVYIDVTGFDVIKMYKLNIKDNIKIP